jgi:hypothetical protein
LNDFAAIFSVNLDWLINGKGDKYTERSYRDKANITYQNMDCERVREQIDSIKAIITVLQKQVSELERGLPPKDSNQKKIRQADSI